MAGAAGDITSSQGSEMAAPAPRNSVLREIGLNMELNRAYHGWWRKARLAGDRRPGHNRVKASNFRDDENEDDSIGPKRALLS